MKEFPIIKTERLILSELKKEDIPYIVEYLQEKVFSEHTSNIPFPYRHEDAEFWLKISREAFERNEGYTFAIRDGNNKILGAVGIHHRGNNAAELGYWVAKPFWNKGYATEAAKAVIDFGFKGLKFHKIYATHFLYNPSSGKVMQKAGMEQEAVLKQHIRKNEEYFDVVMYSVFKKND
ncbi:GNAT family N-acetyltransferase [Chryseobacterium gossypii]|uniref:GNAT family N-acetyltransferase n=1 Tax=Chryseobacterium gossypii TaxID=3231602 RepID=UPI0035267DD0